jgi:hypothetical protein
MDKRLFKVPLVDRLLATCRGEHAAWINIVTPTLSAKPRLKVLTFSGRMNQRDIGEFLIRPPTAQHVPRSQARLLLGSMSVFPRHPPFKSLLSSHSSGRIVTILLIVPPTWVVIHSWEFSWCRFGAVMSNRSLFLLLSGTIVCFR